MIIQKNYYLLCAQTFDLTKSMPLFKDLYPHDLQRYNDI